jgi:hypothetical protein
MDRVLRSDDNRTVEQKELGSLQKSMPRSMFLLLKSMGAIAKLDHCLDTTEIGRVGT